MSPSADPPPINRTTGIDRIERMLSHLLRFGVMLSLSIMLLGITVSLIRHPNYLRDPQTLARLTEPGAAFPHTMRDVVHELTRGRGRAVVTVGLLLLILTPVVRVAACVVAFLYRRDAAFTALTTTVLLILIVSFLFGKIG